MMLRTAATFPISTVNDMHCRRYKTTKPNKEYVVMCCTVHTCVYGLQIYASCVYVVVTSNNVFPLVTFVCSSHQQELC